MTTTQKLADAGYTSEQICLIFATMPDAGEGFIEFDGQNCNDYFDDEINSDPCRGWDGVDRRCDCGNRRVSWAFDGSFATPEAY